MAEVGGPTIAEMQPKPAGVVEKVKGQLRKLFTPEGRAEAMADKQIKTILESVAPEDRIKAMEMLEAKRPDLVATHLSGAKDRLVKEAVVGAAALGVLAVGGGVAIAKREAIMDAAFSMGIRKPNISALEDSIYKSKVIDTRKANFTSSIRRVTSDPVKGFINGMRNRFSPSQTGEMPINLRNLFKDVDDKALDALNINSPVEKIGAEISNGMMDSVAAKLATDFERSLSNNFLTLAQQNNEWVPLVIPKVDGQSGVLGSVLENYKTMIQKGLAVIKNLKDGTVLISPTKKYVDFVRSNATVNKT